VDIYADNSNCGGCGISCAGAVFGCGAPGHCF
jgi:hypothetical protein